jgi:hypothetical protein
MDINTAVQLVLKKSLAHDGLSRGLHEAARAIERVSSRACEPDRQLGHAMQFLHPSGSSNGAAELYVQCGFCCMCLLQLSHQVP